MRNANDQYYSPMKSIHYLMQSLDCTPEVILEPFVGQGDLIQGCKKFIKPNVGFITNDRYPSPKFSPDTENNAVDKSYWENAPKVDAVITNPPYNMANDLIPMMVESDCARMFYAVMLRLSFLEGTKKRGPWLAKNPPHQIIVLPRNSFTDNKKTDTVTSAWMIWYKHRKTIKNPIVIVDKTIPV